MINVYYSDTTPIPLPPGHHFPQAKYGLLRERVEALAAQGLVNLHAAEPVAVGDLLRVHSRRYVAAALEGGLTQQQQRELGFPWSPDYALRARRSVGATLAAARCAATNGWAAHLAGGTHHAFRDAGRGFCLFNDVAVAVHALRAAGTSPRVLVIDADVHQGDGTAALFADDPLVYTLSIHGERNYPRNKMKSDLDVPLPDKTEDAAYLSALDGTLEVAWRASDPQMVYYLAGADPFVDDKYGRMALTKSGLAARDRQVLERCRHTNLPVVTMMAGGYAREIAHTVEIHAATIGLMVELSSQWEGARR